MSLESSAARVEQVARQTLIHNRIIPAEELVARVDAVTPADIRSFAEKMLAAKPPSAVIVGNGRKSAAMAQRAAVAFSATPASRDNSSSRPAA